MLNWVWFVFACKATLQGDSAMNFEVPEEKLPDEFLSEPLQTVDVLIIGGGPAGLMAAQRLHEADVDYMLIEMAEQVGGAALYSDGLMTFSGTETQFALGVEDTPEKLLSSPAVPKRPANIS